MSIYIIFFFALLLLYYYYFYGCIKCIYVPWPWVTPLLSWARSTIKELSGGLVCDETKQEQEALSDQMSFRNISKCCFYDSFSHCCHFYVCFCYNSFFFFSILLMWHMIRMQNSQSVILTTVSENISHDSMGLQIAWQAGRFFCRRLSDGYFYINLPPIFMCLLSVVLINVSEKKKTCCFTLYVLLFSLTKNTWPQRASPAVNPAARLHPHAACWREKMFMWVYSKVTNCSLLCVCTLL